MKPASTKTKSRTDWKRLKAMKDDAIDFSDIPPVDKTLFRHAIVRMPRPKSLISLRLDPDVLGWFKKRGKGYQTQINAVLRAYAEAHSR